MAGEDAKDPTEGPAEGIDRPQDPIVERLRPDPAQQPVATLTLAGFLGKSVRPGFRRLYFSRDLDYYAEFRAEDVVHIASISAEAEPFRGDEATRVMLRRAAPVDYTWTRNARPLDDFDIDVRFGRPATVSGSHVPFLTDSCEHGCGPTNPPELCAFTLAPAETCAGTCEECEPRVGFTLAPAVTCECEPRGRRRR